MKSLPVLLVLVCSLNFVCQVQAENPSMRLTPATVNDQPLAFTIKVERFEDKKKGDYLRFHVTVKAKVADHALSPRRSTELEVFDEEAFVSSCGLQPAERGGEVSYSLVVAAKYAEKSKFLFSEILSEFDGHHYWFYLKDFVEPNPVAKKAAPAAGKYVAYWLTRHPPDATSTEYGPVLLLARLPIEQLEPYSDLMQLAAYKRLAEQPPLLEALALTVETYKKDSIWNPDGRPLKQVQSIGKVRAKAREVIVNGNPYRYEECPVKDVVRLLEHPEGKHTLHRLYAPLLGAEQTARALRLLLKEQLAAEKSK